MYVDDADGYYPTSYTAQGQRWYKSLCQLHYLPADQLSRLGNHAVKARIPSRCLFLLGTPLGYAKQLCFSRSACVESSASDMKTELWGRR